ncbi:MAG: helix-turn-helix domain-containing protein [Ruminiclostridium sp.]|nr:helix-turn-helix domain-containing protein [Ruminiclostridium sp.]
MKENETVRRAARIAGVPLWRLAEKLGVSEPTVYRWLRHPLPKDKEIRILDAISSLEKELV